MPVGDAHLQRLLDRAQVGIQRTAEVAHAQVVGRGEGVAEDQADNSQSKYGQTNNASLHGISGSLPADTAELALPGCWCRPLQGGWRERSEALGCAMIGKLTGILGDKNPPEVLVDCHGVGYEVQVPMSTFYNLPAQGEKVSLLTHFVVREDAQILFGFGTALERSVFRQLIKVSGVGPKMALGVLSGMAVDDLVQAVSAQDAARLVKVPGIGKKTAERLLLELKGKLGADMGAPASVHSGSQSDIQQALVALGYSDKEAAAVLKTLPAGIEVGEGIRLALKALAK